MALCLVPTVLTLTLTVAQIQCSQTSKPSDASALVQNWLFQQSSASCSTFGAVCVLGSTQFEDTNCTKYCPNSPEDEANSKCNVEMQTRFFPDFESRLFVLT